MSGLAAIIQTDGAPAENDDIVRMAKAMAHKGADGNTQWVSGKAALAHASLHTTSQCRTATQPLKSENGRLVIILDGFLSNYDDLRRDLLQRKVRLRNESDAELILGAYEVWGQGCASKLDGEFAFVLWDAGKESAFCARDHQGLRPLVFFEAEDKIVVASDLATLSAGIAVRPEPNFDYLAQVAIGQFHSPEQTAAKAVYRLLPAHSYLFSQAGISRERYWSLPTGIEIRYRRDEDYIDHYRHVLTDCVRRASRTDRPLALEVSGGLDSSAVYCLAHDLFAMDRLEAPSLQGYSLLGAKGSEADEIAFARSAARYVKGELIEVPLFEPSIDWFVDQAKVDQDLPTYTNAAMSISLEKSMVDNGCRVSMGGTGGDQWLDGSLDYYVQHLRAFEWSDFLKSFVRDLPEFGASFILPFALRQIAVAFWPSSIVRALRRFRHGGLQGAPEDYFWLSEASKRTLESGFKRSVGRYKGDFIADRKRARLERAEAQFTFDCMNRQYSRLHLESRSPMFSRAFIEFNATTPEHIRYRGGQAKWIHRQAMKGTVPKDILERTTKAAFPAPHLIEQARAFCKTNSDVITREVCDPSAISSLLNDSRDPEFDLARPVYLWGQFAIAAYLMANTGGLDCGGKHHD